MDPTVVVEGVPPGEVRSSSIDAYTFSTDLYPITKGSFGNFPVSYLMQGANGPCPLLALCNILLFRDVLSLPAELTEITFESLVGKLANILIDKNKAADTDDTLRAILDMSVGLLGSLNKGLDVDVTFNSIDGFEYTDAMSIFDLLDIHVYHGWVVSEDDLCSYPYMCQISYNKALVKLTEYEDLKSKVLNGLEVSTLSPVNRQIIEEGEAISKWLTENSTQLTSDGVIQLNSALGDATNPLAVLFRNNHFSVLCKHNGKLYSLVTDIGFKNTNVMWESLDQLDGDVSFVDYDFNPVQGGARPVETDYDMAMRLQYAGNRTTSIAVPPRNVTTISRPYSRNQKCCTIM